MILKIHNAKNFHLFEVFQTCIFKKPEKYKNRKFI